jgi:hypothetical protein
MNAPIVMKSAGKAPTQIVRRVGEDRVYPIDCSALLRPHELLVRVQGEPAAGLGMQCEARPARGARTLDVRISGSELPEGRQKADGSVRLVVVTTQGVVELALAVRVVA